MLFGFYINLSYWSFGSSEIRLWSLQGYAGHSHTTVASGSYSSSISYNRIVDRDMLEQAIFLETRHMVSQLEDWRMVCHYCLTALYLVNLRMQCINPVYYNCSTHRFFLFWLYFRENSPKAAFCWLNLLNLFLRITQYATSVSYIILRRWQQWSKTIKTD